mmetsp:Transcript_140658/g.448564  ORF Transcript_140658/g.448564 Transcript_140658/m.448564 type:complete len:620 (+) Transcript_140658:76-1935(+)
MQRKWYRRSQQQHFCSSVPLSNADGQAGKADAKAPASAAGAPQAAAAKQEVGVRPSAIAGAGAPPGDLEKPGGLEEFMRGVGEGKSRAKASGSRCSGCGAWLHSDDPQEHGFVPPDAHSKFTSTGRKKTRKEPMGVPVDWVPDGVEVMRDASVKYKVRTRLLTCMRCYRLQHYHRTSGPISGGFYRMEGGREWEHEAEIVEKIVRRLRRESLILMVIDIMDFESSLVPELFDACRNKQLPIIFVINKVDCLPGSAQQEKLERIKVWVRRMSRQVRNVHASDVVLVSAKNAYGFAQLEQRLRHHLEPQDPKWIYVVGRVNSGKSTFVNRFLWYIGHKHQGTVHHKRTVGGVTRSPVPGTTLHLVSFGLPKGFRLVDTPGIPSSNQLTGLLSDGIDLYATVPRKKLNPISYVLHTGRSLLLGAFARIDQVKGGITFMTSFFSVDVTLHVCRTNRVEGLMQRKAGTFFFPPHNEEDVSKLGPLVRHRVEVFGSSDRAWDDIVIAGIGWVAVSGFGTKELDIWVPKGVKVFRRPSLLPHEMKHEGVTRFHVNHRARSPRIFRKKNAIVKERRDKALRDGLRADQAGLETEQASLVEVPDGTAFFEESVELPQEFELVKTKNTA